MLPTRAPHNTLPLATAVPSVKRSLAVMFFAPVFKPFFSCRRNTRALQVQHPPPTANYRHSRTDAGDDAATRYPPPSARSATFKLPPSSLMVSEAPQMATIVYPLHPVCDGKKTEQPC